jgi:hypothetical protein
MKNVLFLSVVVVSATFFFWSCKTQKNTSSSTMEVSKDVKGNEVIVEKRVVFGIIITEALNEKGNGTIKVPYIWWEGIGSAEKYKDNAKMNAESNAYATISRFFQNLVQVVFTEGNVQVGTAVEKAITTYWEQVSNSISSEVGPIPGVEYEFRQKTNSDVIECYAKIGIKGTRYQSILNNATNYKPEGLNKNELDDFMKHHKSIMDRAKGIN